MMTFARSARLFLAVSTILVGGVLASAAHASSYTVTITTDELDGSPACTTGSATDCSLREAIAQANADSADAITISIPAGTYQLSRVGSGTDEDSNSTGDLDIVPQTGSTISLVGAGQGVTTLDGQCSIVSERVIEIVPGSTVNIEDLTIEDGCAETTGDTNGGGIFNEGTLRLDNVTVQNNETSGLSGSSLGGGIYNSSNGTLTIESSRITSNLSAKHAAGIYNDNYTEINNSVIDGNSASHATSFIRGGGIYNNYDLLVTNSEISGNEALALDNNAYGGGIFITNGGTTTIENTTITDNLSYGDAVTSSDGFGGGVYIDDGNTATMNFVTIAENTAEFGGGVSGEATFAGVIFDANVGLTSDSDCYGAMTSNGYNFISDLTSNCTGFNSDTTNLFDTDPELADSVTSVDNAPDYYEFSSVVHSPAVNAIPPSTCVTLLGDSPLDQAGQSRRGYCDAGAFERQDLTDPTIHITNDSEEFNVVECTADYSEQGATGTDDYDPEDAVSETVQISGTVDTDTPGEYSITYTGEDLSTNEATGTRIVTVLDTTDPEIQIDGTDSTVYLNDTYTAPSASATDACDPDVSVDVDNAVDSTVPGEYTVTYSARDAENNLTIETITVTVLSSDEDTREVVNIEKDAGSLTVTFNDDSTTTFEPFGGSSNYEYVLSGDNRRIVVTNGKYVRVFIAQNKIAQKKIHSKKVKGKYLTMKVKKLYKHKSYSDIMLVMSTKAGTIKVVHLRLTNGNELKKTQHELVSTESKRKPQSITVKQKKHRFITHVGKKSLRETTKWSVSKKGNLAQVTE